MGADRRLCAQWPGCLRLAIIAWWMETRTRFQARPDHSAYDSMRVADLAVRSERGCPGQMVGFKKVRK